MDIQIEKYGKDEKGHDRYILLINGNSHWQTNQDSPSSRKVIIDWMYQCRLLRRFFNGSVRFCSGGELLPGVFHYSVNLYGKDTVVFSLEIDLQGSARQPCSCDHLLAQPIEHVLFSPTELELTIFLKYAL